MVLPQTLLYILFPPCKISNPTFITSEGAVSHNVLYEQLPITRYQEMFYANNYFELLPIVSTAFNQYSFRVRLPVPILCDPEVCSPIPADIQTWNFDPKKCSLFVLDSLF